MPIRFRCAYCNQLMGIARRKAGTVVRCPNCSGQVVVPADDEPDEEPEPQPAGVGKVFEQGDFAKKLEGAPAPLPPPAIPVPHPQAGVPAPDDDDDDLVMPPPAPPMPRGINLSHSMATLLTVAVIVVVALAFVSGLLIGRFLLTPASVP